jgi:PAS domain S-box-containing protein
MRRVQQLRAALITLLLCAGYYIGGVIALAVRFPGSGISIAWLPNGALLATLLLTPTRIWWVLVLAVLPVHLHMVSTFQGPVPLVVMLAQWAGNVVQTALAAWVTRLYAGVPPRLHDLRSMGAFILFAAVVIPGLVAAPVVSVFVATGFFGDFWLAWRARFFNQVVVTVSVVPLILELFTGGVAAIRAAPLRRWLEFALLAAGLFFVGSVVLGSDATAAAETPALLYAPLPLLLWAAVRFGLGGLSVALFVIAFLAASHAMLGRGPFSTSAGSGIVVNLQLFLIAISIPLLFLAALVEERRRAGLAALRAERERLRAALDASGTGTLRWDIRAGALEGDENLSHVLGAPSRTIGSLRELLARVHDADRERVARAFDRCAAEAADFEQHFRAVRDDGEVRWIDGRGKTFVDADGKPATMTGAWVDITARHRQEEEFRTLAESVPHHVYMSGPDGITDYANERWFEYTGEPKTKEAVLRWPSYMHPEEREATLERWSQSLARGESFEVEYRYRRRDGEYRWFLGRALPMRDEQGKIARWLGTATDIDDRKRAEQTLRDADRRKDEFLATLGHELRNPLAPITTSLEILRVLLPPGGRPAAQRPRLHRAADEQDDPPGERPSRRVANHAREDQAAAQGPRREPGRRRRGRDQRPGHPGQRPRAVGDAAAGAGPGEGRRGTPRAGAIQPARQRRQVHAGAGANRAHRDQGRRGGRARGQGQRHRHRARRPDARVRPVRPGRPHRRPCPGRARDRPHRRARAGRDAGRHRRGAQPRARSRQRAHRAAPRPCGGRS